MSRKNSEIQTLTQEAANEQSKGFIAPLFHQLEESTRLVPGLATTPHTRHYPRIDYGTTFGTAGYQPDTFRTKMEAESIIIYSVLKQCKIKVYTVKLTRAKVPAKAGNVTCGPNVKRLQTQFTCVTCSLPVEKGKFTRKYAKSTSRGTHTNCLQPHVNLLDYNGFLQVILHAELRQICP